MVVVGEKDYKSNEIVSIGTVTCRPLLEGFVCKSYEFRKIIRAYVESLICV